MNGNIHALFTFQTEYSADSVEWCPHKPYQNLFVCANYQLIKNDITESSNERLGKLLLFGIHPENDLELLQIINTSAILDQKWSPQKIDNYSILAVSNADRSIEIYKLNTDTLKLDRITTCNVDFDTSQTLVLSLDWSTYLFDSNKPLIVSSDSKGKIHLLEFSNNVLSLKNSWLGHDYEAWIAGFYCWDTNIIFSGGDDSQFLKFDRRMGDEPIAKNKSHDAGVTSFHSNASREFIVASGSYDEHIRLWDIRKMKSKLHSIKMPGGLWRLKWDPFENKKLLAACMFGGVHVVDTSADKLEIIASYYGHKNIAYGADWSYLNEKECDKYQKLGQHLIASCSFYDRLLCVSKLHLEI